MCNRREFYKHLSHNQADKFKRHSGSHRRHAWKENFKAAFNNPPANVLELDDKYELHLFAPGYVKSDFLIAVLDQALSISVKDKVEEEANWKRKEYSPKGFLRQFELNEKIDKSTILAKYENGVLILNLPKLEGFETARQEIEVV